VYLLVGPLWVLKELWSSLTGKPHTDKSMVANKSELTK
jgi:hypothetical protein